MVNAEEQGSGEVEMVEVVESWFFWFEGVCGSRHSEQHSTIRRNGDRAETFDPPF